MSECVSVIVSEYEEIDENKIGRSEVYEKLMRLYWNRFEENKTTVFESIVGKEKRKIEELIDKCNSKLREMSYES